jgi:hypothetical protein
LIYPFSNVPSTHLERKRDHRERERERETEKQREKRDRERRKGTNTRQQTDLHFSARGVQRIPSARGG